MTTTALGGTPVTLVGDLPAIGSPAPDFRLIGTDLTTVICVSQDLPFAQARFCGAEGIESVVAASTFRSTFGHDYGVALTDGKFEGLLARAVVVIDRDGTVLHTELVPEIAQEPDYDAVAAALA